MYSSGLTINECPGDRIKHNELALDPQSVDILARHQIAYDAAIEAHAAGKCESQFEAAKPLYCIMGLA